MKRRILPFSGSKLMFFIALVVAVFAGSNIFAADRYAVNASSASWNLTSTWSATSGGSSGASVPVAGDNVYIGEGSVTRTVNIPNGTTVACSNLYMGNNNSNTSVFCKLSFGNATSILNVSGNVILYGPRTTGSSSTTINRFIDLFTGTMTVGGNLELGTGQDNNHAYRICKVTFSSGTLTVGGDIIYNNISGSSSLQTQITGSTGTLNLAGAFTINNNSGTLSFSGEGICNFNGSVAQTIPIGVGSVVYKNLYINNSSGTGAILSSDVTAGNVTGNFKVQTGKLSNGGFAITGISGKSFEVANSATFYIAGTTSAFPSVYTATLGATSTVEYSGSDIQTIVAKNYGNLTSSGTGGRTLAASGTIGVAGTFTPGTNTYTIGGSTIMFNGTSAQTVPVFTFNNLTISNTAGAAAGGNVTVNKVLNLSSANPSSSVGTLGMSTYTLTMGGDATTIGTGDVTGIVQRTTIAPNVEYSYGNQFTTMSLVNGYTMPSVISIKISIGTAPSWRTGAILRYYDIIQTGGNSSTKAMLKLHYLDGEMNSNDEPSLGLFDYTGTTTTYMGRSARNTTNDWVELANISLTYFPNAFNNKIWTLDNSTTSVTTWDGSESTDWNDPLNWSAGVPGPTSNVVIPDVTNNPTLPASTTIYSLQILSGGVLTDAVPSALTIDGGAGAWINDGGSPAFVYGSGTVTFTNVNATMAGETDFFNVDVADGAELTLGSDNIMRIGGDLTLTGSGILNASTAHNTVEYNGATQTIINPNVETSYHHPGYHNLIINNTGDVNMPIDAMDMHGDLTLLTSNRVVAGEVLNVVGSVILGDGSAFDPSTFTHNVGGDWTDNGCYFSSNPTVNFNGIVSQSINGITSIQSFENITVDKTLGTLLNTATLTSLSVTNFTLTSGNFTAPLTCNIYGNAILAAETYFTSGTNTYIAGNWTDNGSTFDPLVHTITFNGSGAQSINGSDATQTFYNMIILNTLGTVTVTGSTTTLNANNFTQTSGNFTAPSTAFYIDGNVVLTSGTYTAGANTYIRGGWTNNSGAFTANSGTVDFTGSNSGKTIAGSSSTTFDNLTISNTAGITLGQNEVVAGNLTLYGGTTFDLSTYACNRATSGGTFLVTSSGLLRCANSNFPTNFTTYTMGNGTVEYYSGTPQSVSNLAAYNNLIIKSGVSGSLIGNLPSGMTGNMTIESTATYDIGSYTTNRASSGGTLLAAGTLRLSGSTGGQTGSNFPTNFGTNTLSGTVEYYGGTQTVYTGATYNNLIITNSGSKSLTSNLTVGGDVTINTLATFDLGTYTGNRTTAGGTLVVSGTMKLGNNTGGQTGSNFPTNFSTLTMTSGGTVDYNGAGGMTQEIYRLPTAKYYSNLTLTKGSGSGTATKTISATPAVIDPLIIKNDLTINLDAQFVVPVIEDITVEGITAINSPRGLWLKSDITGSASFIDNGEITYLNSGTADVELYLTTCIGTELGGCWHYVSSPITNAVCGVFMGDYMKSYITETPVWSEKIFNETTSMPVIKGYAVSEQVTPTGDNHHFIGPLNTDVTAKSLDLQTGTSVGWNLIGNPYPSAIDIDNPDIVLTNVYPEFYLYDLAAANYMIAVTDHGDGATAESQFIPAKQGFFVYAFDNSPSVTFPNAARAHNHDIPFYKSSPKSNSKDVLFLNAQGEGKTSFDRASVVLRDYTTRNFDPGYDAGKLYGSPQAPQLFTIADDNSSLTINSLPFDGRNTTVPLNFTVVENGTGNYAITASNLESFRSGTIITLEDKKAVKTQELTTNPVYNFSYTSGDDPSRFLLHFFNPFYGISEEVVGKELQIYSSGQVLYLKDLTGNPDKGQMFVYNMFGQEMAHQPLADIQVNKYSLNLTTGYYIVRVITRDKTYNGRVYLN